MAIIRIHEQTADKVAAMLLQIQAIKLNAEKPFVWSSGWKSPIYCDNRLSLSYPEIRTAIKNGLVEAISVDNAKAFALGVQWHPEWKVMENPQYLAIFKAFGDACRIKMQDNEPPD